MSVDIKDFPVMKSKCPTCPFHEDTPARVGLANMVRKRCITEASQICHHPRVKGKKETHLCRGARDFQLEVFTAIGVLKEPTDECWSDTHYAIQKKSNV